MLVNVKVRKNIMCDVAQRKEDAMARLTPMKAIRAKCLECSNGQVKEVRLCPIKKCSLYEYRLGHRPKDGEVITEESLGEKS